VIEALTLAGEDASNIRFDDGYGYSVNGRSGSTDDFGLFERRAYGRGGRVLLGEFDPSSGEITIYRNAFSSRINFFRTAAGAIGWQELGASPGFQSSLFVVSHEIGHRVNGHTRNSNQFEFQANRRAFRTYQQVCGGDPRC